MTTMERSVRTYGTSVANTYHTDALSAESVVLNGHGPTKVGFHSETRTLWAEITIKDFDPATGLFDIEIKVLDAPGGEHLILVYGDKGWVSCRNMAGFTPCPVLHHFSPSVRTDGLMLLIQPDGWVEKLPDMGDAFKK